MSLLRSSLENSLPLLDRRPRTRNRDDRTLWTDFFYLYSRSVASVKRKERKNWERRKEGERKRGSFLVARRVDCGRGSWDRGGGMHGGESGSDHQSGRQSAVRRLVSHVQRVRGVWREETHLPTNPRVMPPSRATGPPPRSIRAAGSSFSQVSGGTRRFSVAACDFFSSREIFVAGIHRGSDKSRVNARDVKGFKFV